jgi:hypothetical protein
VTALRRILWATAFAVALGSPAHADHVHRWEFTYRPWFPSGPIAEVLKVPGPTTDEDVAESAERDRRWTARCRPTVREDARGVPRYQYAAPDCDLGKTED